MKRIILLVTLVASLLPAAARAQVDVRIQLGLPVAPPLVVVQPGIQVVENHEDEVFYTRGWYWARRDGYWYRSRTPRAAFVYVEPRYVPAPLVRIPPGHYRHWRRDEAKAERKAWKEHEKEERKARREHEKAERHEEHGHGHGHHGE